MKLSDAAYSKNIETSLLEILNESAPEQRVRSPIWIVFDPVSVGKGDQDERSEMEFMDIVHGQKNQCTVHSRFGQASLRAVTASQVAEALELPFVTGGMIGPDRGLRMAR